MVKLQGPTKPSYIKAQGTLPASSAALVMCTNYALAEPQEVFSLLRAANYLCLNKKRWKAKSKNHVLANRQSTLPMHFHTCKAWSSRSSARCQCKSKALDALHCSWTVGWSQMRSPKHWGSSTDAMALNPIFMLHVQIPFYAPCSRKEDGPWPASSRAVGAPTGEQSGSITSLWRCTGAASELGTAGTPLGYLSPAKDSGVPPHPQPFINYF